MRSSRFLQQDKTEKVYTSARQEGTLLYFTGAGDDVQNGVRGNGPNFLIDNSVNKAALRTIDIQFMEDIFIKDGVAFWEGAAFGDNVSLEVILPANTAFVSETGTGNANMVNGTPTYITASPTPDETWVGTHLYFPVEIVVYKFVNKLHMIGSNTVGMVLESSDAAIIQKELKLRMKLESPTQSDIKVIGMLEIYRHNTV